MAASQPGPRYTGIWFDSVNNRVALYIKGTRMGYFSSSALQIESGITADFDGTVNFDGGVDMDSTFNTAGATLTPNLKRGVTILGSTAAVASNGSDAILPDIRFVAPFDLTIVAAHRVNISASDVTVGTSVSSASYRRLTLVTNTAGTGSGTNIVASLNATASAASNASRAFTTVASTVPAGAIILASHLTVGAATADGTDMAAGFIQITYEQV